MILWLDHILFGDGFGLGSPSADQRFYWLSGELYTFWPGFGAQLHSIQWTRPKPGERRILSGREFVVFNTQRVLCRVIVSWAMVNAPKDVDAFHADMRKFRDHLGSNLPEQPMGGMPA